MKTLIVLISLSLAGSCSDKSHSYKNLDRQDIGIKEMLDGRVWTTENLEIKTFDSYCQKDEVSNCDRYGRLYTWEDAIKACKQLGKGWRLPSKEEWQTLATAYGGSYGQSNDNGQLAYLNLTEGGTSGFKALLGGNRGTNGMYERLDAHGFYWTATEYDQEEAWFYNFANGSGILNRHTGDKGRAASVRCIKEI